MQLFIFFALCLVAAASDAHKAVDKPFVPRYTLLAESKKKDQDLDQLPSDLVERQPWRRLAYGGFGGQQTGWPGPMQTASLGPGLLLLGVNLGALLYMLLGLLGLAPAQRIGTWHAGDMYRNDRQHLGAGKESTLYF